MDEPKRNYVRRKERKEFTPAQERILAILSDGQLHLKSEVLKALEDDQADYMALWQQLCKMRKVLRPKGQDIMTTQYQRKTYCRHIRMLVPPE